MQYRNELKHLITPGDRAAICAVMKTVAQLDPYAQAKGYYTIRSLYFDNIADKALREKLDGVNEREKFRIRYYNNDTSVIHLEKKTPHLIPPRVPQFSKLEFHQFLLSFFDFLKILFQ